MFLKIYFDNKPLFLCDEIDITIEEFVHHDDAIYIDELDGHTIRTMIHEMQLEKVHAGIFQHKDFDELKKAFFKKFTLVIASGGLVTNESDDVLLIFRRGKWDLPKGKLDKGETLEQCAVREVEEETGLKNISLHQPLTITYHTYHEGTKFILKESHWFKMSVKEKQDLVAQEAEGITETKWVRPADLKTYFDETYPSVRDVLKFVYYSNGQPADTN